MVGLWLGLFAVVGVLLGWLYREMRPIPRGHPRDVVAWFVRGVAFAGVVYAFYEHAWLGATLAEPSDRPGADAALVFLAAYLFAYALELKQLDTMARQLRLHRIPQRHHAPVAWLGLVGTLVVRLVIVVAVVALVRVAPWMLAIGGVFTVWMALGAPPWITTTGTRRSPTSPRAHANNGCRSRAWPGATSGSRTAMAPAGSGCARTGGGS